MLRPYQQIGVAWLNSRRTGLLADDMGLGKSIQTIAAIPDDNPPVLVVCPASVKGVWEDELFKWRKDYKVTIYQGRDAFTRFPQRGEVVVVNYDVLPLPKEPDKAEDVFDYVRRLEPVVQNPKHWDGAPKGMIVIADEAHMLKDWKSRRTKAFSMLRNTALWSGGRVWLLTGTPLMSRPDDLWNVLGAANLEREAYGTYDKFCSIFGGYKEKTKRRGGGIITVQKWMDPDWTRDTDDQKREGFAKVALRRKKSEVLTDLPPKQYQDIVVPLSKEALKECEVFMEKLQQLKLSIDDFIDLASQKKLPLDLYSKLKSALAAAKRSAAIELIESYESANEPLVVFSDHRPLVDELAKRKMWDTINGSIETEIRPDIVRSFQSGHLRGISATIAAAGVGITLTAASNAIFVDRNWTPALNNQAEDRLHRFGQTRGVLIIRLIGDHPMERRISEVLDRKQRMLESVL